MVTMMVTWWWHDGDGDNDGDNDGDDDGDGDGDGDGNGGNDVTKYFRCSSITFLHKEDDLSLSKEKEIFLTIKLIWKKLLLRPRQMHLHQFDKGEKDDDDDDEGGDNDEGGHDDEGDEDDYDDGHDDDGGNW